MDVEGAVLIFASTAVGIKENINVISVRENGNEVHAR